MRRRIQDPAGARDTVSRTKFPGSGAENLSAHIFRHKPETESELKWREASNLHVHAQWHTSYCTFWVSPNSTTKCSNILTQTRSMAWLHVTTGWTLEEKG